VRLNKDLIKVGADALKANMTSLGPLVLPYSEQLKFAGNAALRMAAKRSKALAGSVPARWLRPYVPDFTKAFDFFCIHTGQALCCSVVSVRGTVAD
jgi:3-ketoacyl-CoA synthase